MTLPSSSGSGGGVPSQHFLLKWNNHRSNMVNVFESLLQSENLVDVTIAVEGKFLKAHKIVLSACSPYFQSMFVNHTPQEKYPVLVFHDMKHAHLKTLLDFMYRGEISIDEKDLGEVLKVAEALSIRGLSSFESDDEDADTPNKQEEGKKEQSTGSSSAPQQGHSNDGGGGSGNQQEEGHHEQGSNSISTSQGHTSGSNAQNGGSRSGTPTVATKGRPKKQKPQQHQSVVGEKIDPIGIEKGTAIMNASMKGINGGKWGKDRSVSPTSRLQQAPPPPPPPQIKKKRGRQPKNKEGSIQTPSTTDIGYSKPSTNKLGTKYPLSLDKVPRQGVRRRLPRRFPGVPTRLKRIKMGKRDPSDAGGEEEGMEFDPLPPEEAALLQEMLDGADCEPLSEMSVRGLDLFKYASIEDGVYRCIECEKLRIPKTFKNKYSFQRHAFLYHEGNMRKVFPCPVCSREFSRPDKMKNHMRSIHEGGGPNGNKGPPEQEPKVEVDDEDENSCDS